MSRPKRTGRLAEPFSEAGRRTTRNVRASEQPEASGRSDGTDWLAMGPLSSPQRGTAGQKPSTWGGRLISWPPGAEFQGGLRRLRRTESAEGFQKVQRSNGRAEGRIGGRGRDPWKLEVCVGCRRRSKKFVSGVLMSASCDGMPTVVRWLFCRQTHQRVTVGYCL